MRPPTRVTRAKVCRTSGFSSQASGFSNGSNEDIPAPPAMNSEAGKIFAADTMKEKKPRHRMTGNQLARLEALYKENTHPTRELKQSLASEVGMPLKNVTIWFQNKRQTTRRKSARFSDIEDNESLPANTSVKTSGVSVKLLIGLTPSPKESIPQRRAPLATPSLGDPVEGRHSASLPTPSGTNSGGNADFADDVRPGTIRAQDLWTYLPSSPPTPALVHSLPGSPSPLVETDVFGPIIESLQGAATGPGKRKADLAWACARAEKRARPSLDESKWSPDMSSELDSSSSVMAIRTRQHGDRQSQPQVSVPSLSQFRINGMVLKTRAARSERLAEIEIPMEYHEFFSPDIIEGASLLLGFKYTGDARATKE